MNNYKWFDRVTGDYYFACRECGALVLDIDTHAAWHGKPVTTETIDGYERMVEILRRNNE